VFDLLNERNLGCGDCIAKSAEWIKMLCKEMLDSEIYPVAVARRIFKIGQLAVVRGGFYNSFNSDKKEREEFVRNALMNNGRDKNQLLSVVRLCISVNPSCLSDSVLNDEKCTRGVLEVVGGSGLKTVEIGSYVLVVAPTHALGFGGEKVFRSVRVGEMMGGVVVGVGVGGGGGVAQFGGKGGKNVYTVALLDRENSGKGMGEGKGEGGMRGSGSGSGSGSGRGSEREAEILTIEVPGSALVLVEENVKFCGGEEKIIKKIVDLVEKL